MPHELMGPIAPLQTDIKSATMPETRVAPLLWKTPPQGNSPRSLGGGHTVSITAQSKGCGITAPSARPSRGSHDLPPPIRQHTSLPRAMVTWRKPDSRSYQWSARDWVVAFWVFNDMVDRSVTTLTKLIPGLVACTALRPRDAVSMKLLIEQPIAAGLPGNAPSLHLALGRRSPILQRGSSGWRIASFAPFCVWRLPVKQT